MRRSRIARYHERFDIAFDELTRTRRRIAHNRLRRAISVGHARRIAKIDKIFVRQCLTKRLEHRQSTYPTVKYPYRLLTRSIHLYISIMKTVPLVVPRGNFPSPPNYHFNPEITKLSLFTRFYHSCSLPAPSATMGSRRRPQFEKGDRHQNGS